MDNITFSLKPLTSTQTALLCDRDRYVQEIAANCAGQRLTVLTADSGLGSSSLLQAGLVPGLRQRGMIPISFSDWEGRYFTTAFKETIAKAVRDDADPNFYAEEEQVQETLSRAVSRAGDRLVLLLDCFGDYLRCHGDADRAQGFDAEMSQVLSYRRVATVVVVDDGSLLRLERFAPYVPNLLGHRIVLGPIDEAGARALMQTRAAAAMMAVEAPAMQALLGHSSVRYGNGYHPFFLSIAMSTWVDREKEKRSNSLQIKTLQAAAGGADFINEALDPVLNDLPSTHKELFFRWCTLLIAKRQARNSVPEKTLELHAGRLNRFVLTLLPRLTATGILRPVEYADGVRYELTRESMVPIVQNWWDRREAGIIARRRAVFRVTSVSLALGAIAVAYLIYLLVPGAGQ